MACVPPKTLVRISHVLSVDRMKIFGLYFMLSEMRKLERAVLPHPRGPVIVICPRWPWVS